MVEDIYNQVLGLLPNVKGFFNSTFFTSIAGAFAGAYGAQVISERGKFREQLLNEIRSVNTAIMVTFGICNSLITIKKQHVKRLKENHDSDKARIIEAHEKTLRNELPPGTVTRFSADFQTLSLTILPIEILQQIVFQKLSLNGRPIALATTLGQTLHSLGMSMEKRNQLIEIYKGSELTQDQLIILYFGLPHGGGYINNDYPSSVDAIYSQTDDGIKFAELLCADLVKHGEDLAKVFKKKFGAGAPRINKPEWDLAKDAGLMPTDDNYKDWFTTFQTKIEPTKWQAFKKFIFGRKSKTKGL